MSIESALIKHQEKLYREYISDHITNVQKAWKLMKENPDCMDFISRNLKNMTLDAAISVLDDLIAHHDESKYSKEEFDAYRKEFYSISPEEKEANKKDLEKAWEHHYTNNLHHWDWWYKSGNMNNMPFIHVIEMICDWEAMGYVFKNNSLTWYNQNKKEIFLGDKQRKFAEELMEIVCR